MGIGHVLAYLFSLGHANIKINIVKLREREGQRVDLGRSLKGQKSQRSRIKLLMDQVR